jgi:hypothetical protein
MLAEKKDQDTRSLLLNMNRLIKEHKSSSKDASGLQHWDRNGPRGPSPWHHDVA